MYDIEPPAVYVHKSIMDNETYRQRMEHVVAACNNDVSPIAFTDDDLPDMLHNGLTANCKAMGTLEEIRDPILLFNTFRFDGRREERMDWLQSQSTAAPKGGMADALLGYGAFHWFHRDLASPVICRRCWRIHFQRGCLHRCHYCGFGGLLTTMVNVEDYCQHLGAIVERHPWQKTYLIDDDADPVCMEPELGCMPKLIEWFGTLDDRYLIFHTKTWNTKWLRGLKHNGNTMLVWSLSCPTQATEIEPKTGTTEERIEAARIAQEAGYQIRYKFKPIIPVRNWREEARYTIDLLFQKTRPDVINFCIFMWMSIDELKHRLPVDLLAPDYIKAAEDAAEQMAGDITGPFPVEKRIEMYDFFVKEIRKHDPDVPVAPSTESLELWERFGPTIGYTASDYVCGCGPIGGPGETRLTCDPFKVAVRNAQPGGGH